MHPSGCPVAQVTFSVSKNSFPLFSSHPFFHMFRCPAGPHISDMAKLCSLIRRLPPATQFDFRQVGSTKSLGFSSSQSRIALAFNATASASLSFFTDSYRNLHGFYCRHFRFHACSTLCTSDARHRSTPRPSTLFKRTLLHVYPIVTLVLHTQL